MTLLHGIAGGFFSVAWFIFADGAVFASRRDDTRYEFVEALPGIFCIIAMLLMLMVDISAIQGESFDALGFSTVTDSSAIIRSRIVFFVGALMALTGLTIAVWQMSTRYKTGGTWWPGLALLLEVVSFCTSASCLIASKARANAEQSDGF